MLILEFYQKINLATQSGKQDCVLFSVNNTQWGTVECGASAANGSGSGTASLPIAFPTAGTLVSASMATGGHSQNWDAISMWGELNGLTKVTMHVAATFATNGAVGRYVAVGH
jgi:hypothetical protein